MKKAPLLFASLALALVAASSRAETTPYWENPEGYYDRVGQHADLNAKAGNGAALPDALGTKTVNDTLSNQFKQMESPAPGETLEQFQIRRARVPLSLVPEIDEAIVSKSSKGREPGKLGLDEKLTEARRMAISGKSAAQGTYSLLISAYIENVINAMQNGMNPDARQIYQAAADAVYQEYQNMVGVAGMWQEKADFYKAGRQVVTHDYERAMKQESATGAPGAATSKGAPPPAAGRRSLETEDSDKARPNVELPEKFRQQLIAKGVDPDEFAEKLASGELKTAEEANAFLGITTSYTEAQAEAGRELAMGQLADQGFTPPGSNIDGAKDGRDRIVVLDEAALDDKKPAPDAISRALGVFNAPGNDTPEGRAAARRKAALRKNGKGVGTDELPTTRTELQAVLRKLLRQRAELTSAAAPVYYGLLSQGIQTSVHGQNVFQLAHRNYRGFGKWRGPRKARARSRYAVIGE